MTKAELFIKEKGVNISKMEKELGLPAKTIRPERGLPKKHLRIILEYLNLKYGYSDENYGEEVDVPLTKKPEKVIVRVWNKNFVPKYADGIVRYQDPENGLWKRLDAWQRTKHTNKDTGEITVKLNPEFEPRDGKVLSDQIGRYYVAKNGIKVYKFDKPISVV